MGEQIELPSAPDWYPKPGDIVTFSESYAQQLPPIGNILSISPFDKGGMTGNGIAMVEVFKLGAQAIPTGYLIIIDDPKIIEAYNAATEAIKKLEGMLRDG